MRKTNPQSQLMAVRSFVPNGEPKNPEGTLLSTCYTGTALVRPARANCKKFPTGAYAKMEVKIFVDRNGPAPSPGFYTVENGIWVKK